MRRAFQYMPEVRPPLEYRYNIGARKPPLQARANGKLEHRTRYSDARAGCLGLGGDFQRNAAIRLVFATASMLGQIDLPRDRRSTVNNDTLPTLTGLSDDVANRRETQSRYWDLVIRVKDGSPVKSGKVYLMSLLCHNAFDNRKPGLGGIILCPSRAAFPGSQAAAQSLVMNSLCSPALPRRGCHVEIAPQSRQIPAGTNFRSISPHLYGTAEILRLLIFSIESTLLIFTMSAKLD